MPTSYQQHLADQEAAIQADVAAVAAKGLPSDEIRRALDQLTSILLGLYGARVSLFNIVGNILGLYHGTASERARGASGRQRSLEIVKAAAPDIGTRLAAALGRVDSMIERAPDCAEALGRLLARLYPHTVPRY